MMNICVEELQSVKPIVLSVIGPTNEGKTSVLRTLTGDTLFGDVNAYTGTTSRAQIQKVFYQGMTEILQLIDTPGFQMSGAILDQLEENHRDSYGMPEILAVIPQKDPDYLHDWRAWNEVARSDMIILVVSVMESPTQSLIRDTLTLLRSVTKPVIVVFNNVPVSTSSPMDVGGTQEDLVAQWRQFLHQHGFHLMQFYDAHRRNFADEYELFDKIRVHLHDPLQQKMIKLEMTERINRESLRVDSSRKIIAEMLLDIVCYQEVKTKIDEGTFKETVNELEETFKKNLIQREHSAHVDLLKVWDFHLGILDRKNLTLDDLQQEQNTLFGNHVRTHFQLGGGVGAGVGAAIGLGLDVALAGLSLGTGMAVGALLGGIIGGSVGGFYNYRYDKKRKKITIQPEKKFVTVVLSRAIDLVRKLQMRGKAIEDGIQLCVSSAPAIIQAPELERFLHSIASNHPFSSITCESGNRLQQYFFKVNEEKHAALSKIQELLTPLLPNPESVLNEGGVTFRGKNA